MIDEYLTLVIIDNCIRYLIYKNIKCFIDPKSLPYNDDIKIINNLLPKIFSKSLNIKFISKDNLIEIILTCELPDSNDKIESIICNISYFNEKKSFNL
jgi:hypothetical protein